MTKPLISMHASMLRGWVPGEPPNSVLILYDTHVVGVGIVPSDQRLCSHVTIPQLFDYLTFHMFIWQDDLVDPGHLALLAQRHDQTSHQYACISTFGGWVNHSIVFILPVIHMWSRWGVVSSN